MKSYEQELKQLLVGLEIRNIEHFIKKGRPKDFLRLGILYHARSMQNYDKLQEINAICAKPYSI